MVDKLSIIGMLLLLLLRVVACCCVCFDFGGSGRRVCDASCDVVMRSSSELIFARARKVSFHDLRRFTHRGVAVTTSNEKRECPFCIINKSRATMR
jgi:hypothetical protein